MYELVKINEHDYYIDAPSKVGVYRVSDDEVYLIDSGVDRPHGKQIKAVLDGEGWKLRAIFITHAHADHTGGATYLAKTTGADVYARGLEANVMRSSILGPITYYGGMPSPEIMHKVFLAEKVEAKYLDKDALPAGLSIIDLAGHTPEMVGYLTDGGTAYIGDAVVSEETLSKNKIAYVYNPELFYRALDTLRQLDAKIFVPAHAEAAEDISELITKNFENSCNTLHMIRDILKDELSIDEVTFELCRRLEVEMNITQYVLIGNTVRSYISHILRKGELGVHTNDFTFKFKKY